MYNENLSADKPIVHEDQDQFRRIEFAKRLAKTISSEKLSEGYVIGLYSIWGYGKTSTLNLIETELKAVENIEIVKYNPWLFTDQASMIKGLFDLIANALDEKLHTTGEKVGGLLQKYGGMLSPITMGVGDQSGSAGGVAQGVGNLLNNANLEELKERVDKFFEDSEKRLVIIIDDVDRLDKDELFQLFKLIKIAVDFDKITYLIAFDDIVVSKILQDRFPSEDKAGQNYIEKIIQVQLHLPLIDQNSLDRYLIEGIENIFEEYEIAMSYEDASNFRDVYDRLISQKIQTPRAANRYLNSLKFIIPLVGSDINYSDLLVVEIIRMLYPNHYHKLRTSKKILTGNDYHFMVDDDEPSKAVLNLIDKNFKDEDNLIELLRELFPAVDNAYNSHRNQIIYQDPLKVAKKVASIDYFDRYFTYGIPPDDVSDTRILDALSKTDHSEIFDDLNEIISVTNENTVIDKIKQYYTNAANGTQLAIALTELVNNVSGKKTTGWNRTPLELTADIITDICKSLPDKHTEFVLSVFEKMDNIDQFTMFTRDLLLYSNEEQTEKLLNQEELATVKTAIVDKIKEFTSESEPLHKRGLSYVSHLYKFWSDISGIDDVSTYIEGSITNAEEALDLITMYTSTWYGGGPPHRGDLDKSAYWYLVSVIEADFIYSLLKEKFEGESVDTYPNFEDGLNVVGNETSVEFRTILAKQYMYIYENKLMQDTPDAK